MQGVEHAHKLGTVDGISGSETTARKHTQLEELGDSTVLGHLCRREGERERERESFIKQEQFIVHKQSDILWVYFLYCGFRTQKPCESSSH